MANRTEMSGWVWRKAVVRSFSSGARSAAAATVRVFWAGVGKTNPENKISKKLDNRRLIFDTMVVLSVAGLLGAIGGGNQYTHE